MILIKEYFKHTLMSSALELQKTRIDFIIAERSLRPQKYWISILQYLEGLLSQAELFEIVKECLGLENSIYVLFII